jgi:dihydroxyacid dehydratase/phosphogluconate dehydratase
VPTLGSVGSGARAPMESPPGMAPCARTHVAEDLTRRRILTREAFENAIVIHAAIGGSTNALLHLLPLAQEAGVEITIDDFDRIHRQSRCWPT